MFRASILGFLLYAALSTRAAQAQPTCEPENSPRCRYVTACLKLPGQRVVGVPLSGGKISIWIVPPSPTPPTHESCSCIWGVLARAFPVEEHALVAEFWEAAAAGKGSDERVKAVLPDASKRRGFFEKLVDVIRASATARECAY
jgi:hypothetical protein